MASGRREATERGKQQADAKARERQAKSGRGKQGERADAGRPSVANHPRAAASVRRLKGLGGLLGFAVAALLAHSAGLPAASVLERALLAGIGGYVLAWACAVAIWRQIVLAELRMIFDLHQQHVRAVSGSSGGEGANVPGGTPGANGS